MNRQKLQSLPEQHECLQQLLGQRHLRFSRMNEISMTNKREMPGDVLSGNVWPCFASRLQQSHRNTYTSHVICTAQHTTLQLWVIDCGKLVERPVLPPVAETATVTQQTCNYGLTQNIQFCGSISRTHRSKNTCPLGPSLFL